MYGTDKVSPAAADLADRSPLNLAELRVVPATRVLSGASGTVVVQPRVMQLLLALADARGAVVTRDALALRCWGGRFVAEDSLNAAIAELRKALRTASSHGVTIETVPKTGYRLAGAVFGEQSYPEPLHSAPLFTRRLAVAGGVAATAGVGAAWWLAGDHDDREVALLIERGSQALRQGLPDADAQGVQFLQKAVAIEPGNAKAWGMLAIASRASAEYGGPDRAAAARTGAEMAARHALTIDPRQSDALTALATLTPSFGDWAAAERRLRDVLAIDPDNYFATAALGTLMMSTGQVRASLAVLDELARRDPLSPNVQFRRVYTLWSVGRIADMDLNADRALQSWPSHPAVWFARFWTLAFTSRARAAGLMLADSAARPAMPPPAVELLRVSLDALEAGSSRAVERAIDAHTAAASRGPGPATTAIMFLSQFRAATAAYEVARGFLIGRGPVVVQQRHTPAQASITDQHHRMTMMLWVPATLTLRLHPDFRSLCDEIGLLAYWKATRSRPDFALGSLAAI